LKTRAAKLHLPALAVWIALGVFLALALAALVTHHLLAALGFAAAAHALFCATAVIPNHPWTGPLITRFATAHRDVWLTIDDGPHPASTPGILEALRRHGAKATFFLIGRRARRHPELVRAIVADGHSLGNHTETHPAASLWTAGPGRLSREVDRAAESIRAAGGPAPRFFRPPVGMANLLLAPVLAARNLLRVGWSARGFDTRPQNADVMIERIMRQCSPGAIILFHEIGATAGAANLERLLVRLREENLACVLPPDSAFTAQGRAGA
jgi:peptidoglycan-N-acetylglucosamine deacetylase